MLLLTIVQHMMCSPTVRSVASMIGMEKMGSTRTEAVVEEDSEILSTSSAASSVVAVVVVVVDRKNAEVKMFDLSSL